MTFCEDYTSNTFLTDNNCNKIKRAFIFDITVGNYFRELLLITHEMTKNKTIISNTVYIDETKRKTLMIIEEKKVPPDVSG